MIYVKPRRWKVEYVLSDRPHKGEPYMTKHALKAMVQKIDPPAGIRIARVRLTELTK